MSWYNFNEDNLTQVQKNYLLMIENVFRVRYPNGKWDFIKLQPHQKYYHSKDIAIQGYNAKNSITKKSRNTSYTTNTIIRLLTGNYLLRDERVPFVRINMEKVKELLEDTKDIIKHMRPLKIIYCANCYRKFENEKIVCKCGHNNIKIDYWPFDNNKVIMDNSFEIKFPDRDIKYIGYPASSNASENIRSLRITRNFVDEGNFMLRFYNIHIASRDAARGTDENEQEYLQLNYGSTLKGETEYSRFIEKMETLSEDSNDWEIYNWPIYNPDKFNLNEAKAGVSFEQQGLKPLVFWLTNKKLWNKFIEDEKSFLEEYMAIKVSSDLQFYSLDKIKEIINEKLQNMSEPSHDGEYKIGIDPSGEGNDFFSISIVEDVDDVKQILRFIYYIQKADLTHMQNYCEELILKWKPAIVRVDSNGIGYQLGQYLKNKFSNIELLKGKISIKVSKNNTVTLNEYLHTNLKKLISFKTLEIFEDELLLRQFASFTNDYKCESTKEYGHGDNIMSLGYACLPYRWRKGDINMELESNVTNEIKPFVKSNDELKNYVIAYNNQALINKINDYRKKI